jgi:hypothetical protein
VGNNIFFYNNSLSVVKRALNERLYYVKTPSGLGPCPQPQDKAFEELGAIRRQLLRCMPYHPPVWTNQQFVNSYTGLKAKRYATAAKRLETVGPKRSMGFWNTFIKAEWYDGTIKKNPCPRLIQPRSFAYNVLIGRYIRPMEKALYGAIDGLFGYHVVMKCDAPWDRAQTIAGYWHEFNNPVFVGFDASRFDQHVSVDALKYEHSVYNAIFKSPELSKYLGWQIDNVGYASVGDGLVKYTCEGKRGSGDMNTSCGNVLIMCSIVYKFLNELGVKTRFINDGDDGGVIIESQHLSLLEPFASHCLRFGFEMEIEDPVYELERVEFCQSNPVNMGGGNWMMVRNVHKCIKLDRCSITSRDWATFEEVQHATGVCGLALYEGVPVLDAWYSSMLSPNVRADRVERLLQDMKFSTRSWRSMASKSRPFLVDQTVARISMYKAFGILPDVQKMLEDEFRAIKFQSQKRKIYPRSEDTIQYYIE